MGPTVGMGHKRLKQGSPRFSLVENMDIYGDVTNKDFQIGVYFQEAVCQCDSERTLLNHWYFCGVARGSLLTLETENACFKTYD